MIANKKVNIKVNISLFGLRDDIADQVAEVLSGLNPVYTSGTVVTVYEEPLEEETEDKE